MQPRHEATSVRPLAHLSGLATVRIRSCKRFGLTVALLVGLMACAPNSSPANAESETPKGSEPDLLLAEMGEEAFGEYCASCHGVDARGNGPVSAALQTPPADLRRIAQRRGGDFPAGEIARKIDGRFEIGAHGSREMPVWGRVFSSETPDVGVGESISRGKVAVLIEYLKTIQDQADVEANNAVIRQTMGQIFSAMRVLLPLSLSQEGFSSPDSEAEVRRALDLLDRSSASLGQHGTSNDVGFAHLARSLSIEARDIRLRYESGHRREARYLVQTLTETCVACHSRLPGTSAPRSATFVGDVEVLELPIDQQAKLAYATRQFDSALGHYENILASAQFAANDIDLEGHLDDYLELAIRVRRDPARANRALTGFATRKDLSKALREEVENWIVDLSNLSKRKEPSDPIEAARKLVKADAPRFDERNQLVEHLEASGLLHRALERQLTRTERAEAYALLGLIETRIGRTYWLSQAEAYLETAIRLAPGEPVAQRAYQQLEEFLVAGYSGSRGTEIPPDIQSKLDQLRVIADPS